MAAEAPRISTLMRVKARPLTLRIALLAAMASTAAGLGGCSRPLLSPNDERSQYDRYDRVRNKYSDQYVEDAYGVRSPNLRGRLSPKD